MIRGGFDLLGHRILPADPQLGGRHNFEIGEMVKDVIFGNIGTVSEIHGYRIRVKLEDGRTISQASRNLRRFKA